MRVYAAPFPSPTPQALHRSGLIGGVSGGTVTTTPTKTTTYTLNATNQFGRTTAQVTVTVH